MADVPQAITVNGDTYTVPGADTIEALSASVTYDGTNASGAFKPCLSIYSQDGHLISRTFPSDAVAQGSSAEVSFIPFVPPASGGAGGIQFDTEPQSGDWLYLETTGQGPTIPGRGNYGVAIRTSDAISTLGGMLLTATQTGSGTADGLDLFVTTVNGNHLGILLVSEATGNGNASGQLITCDADGSGRAIGFESDTTAHGAGLAKAMIASAETDGGGVATGVDASASATVGGNAIAGAFGATAAGGGTAYAVKVSRGFVDLKLPTSAGPTGTLWNNGGVVTVA